MAEAGTKLPVKSETKGAGMPRMWRPFETLRQEVDRLFEDFDGGFFRAGRPSLFDLAPFGRTEMTLSAPAVDVAEKENEFEITAELPGMDEKDIEVKLANGGLLIKGEKKAETEEKKKDYYVSERRYGAFERYFGLPDGVDAEKISASFKKGVLTITLPKTPEAKKQEKKIDVRSA